MLKNSTANSNSLVVLWISCSSHGPSSELLEECRRSCGVATTLPSRALATLRKNAFSLVVFEFGSPDAADLHLLQNIKRIHSSVPILMITESHSEELAIWAFRARVWNYLVKPVPLRELTTNLRQLSQIAAQRDKGSRQIERPAALVPPNPGPETSDRNNDALSEVIDTIQRTHASRLRVAQLARSCGMSRFRFARCFKSRFGCSCSDYVLRLRIQTACRMLKVPGISVTRVAMATGFSDASYFARQFRKHMNKSPFEYASLLRRARQQKTRRLREPPRSVSQVAGI